MDKSVTLFFIFSLVVGQAVSRYSPCGYGCMCKEGRRVVSCIDQGFEGLPPFERGANLQTQVLGLQRNRIRVLDTIELMLSYPSLRQLDLQEQHNISAVEMVGDKLPYWVEVFGKLMQSFFFIIIIISTN